MTKVAFRPMLAEVANYPKAAIPLFPPPSLSGLSGRKRVSVRTAFLQKGESFVQGRYALTEALRRAGVGLGKAVLLPAFHCRAIVEPVLYLGAEPCFYPVKADLRPDFSALSSLLNGKPPVVAMVMTHYFGFPNDVDAAQQYCAAHGIALIEDCAHALYGHAGERLLGTVGSYAIASPWKFLSMRDCAILLDNSGGHPTRRTAQPWLNEIKALAAMLQSWSQRVWRRPCLPDVDVPMLFKQAKLIAVQPVAQRLESGLKEFIPGLEKMLPLRLSRWLMAHGTHEHIASRRRANYLRWLEGMRLVPGVQPLFPELPEVVVPYAFPLLIDPKGIGFHLLKMAGIPFWRWEDMAVTDCAISNNYRIRVLQLPCHQELSAEELNWMIHNVQALFSQLNQENPQA